MASLYDTFHFMRAFVADPVVTGSVIPSSRFLAKRMLRGIAWETVDVAVELGPGVGGMTERILSHMPSSGKLIAIDKNRELLAALRRRVRDPRLHVVHGDAVEMQQALQRFGSSKADCIVCGLPFANMPPAARIAIVRACHESLRDGGALVLFQYRTLLLPLLEEMFGTVIRDYEFRNFPPAHVFRCVT